MLQKCTALLFERPVGYQILKQETLQLPQKKYNLFLRDLLSRVPVQRLTLGGICSYQNARGLMERKLGRENAISDNFAEDKTANDGRARYGSPLRISMYTHLLRIAQKIRPDLELALCLEDQAAWKAVNKEVRLGICNCIL